MARRPRPGAREALLDAAREEFARLGVERARVEDIARRAGISKGAFYLHFRSKEDALGEIGQRFLGALEDHARRRHELEERAAREAAEDRRPDAILAAECASDADLLELLWHNRALVAALDGAGRYRDMIAEFRRRMRSLVVGRLAERQRAGALRPDVPAETAADLVMGAYDDFARRMAAMDGKPDLAAWARSVLVVLYEGLLPRAPAARRRAAPRPPIR